MPGRRAGLGKRRRTIALVAIGMATLLAIGILLYFTLKADRPPVRQIAAAPLTTEQLPSDPIAHIDAFGDSITAGYGLEAGQAWPYILAARLGVPFSDSDMHAVLGGAVMDWGGKAYQVHPGRGDLSLILPGYNDVRANGDDPEKLAHYRSALAAYITWLALPDIAKSQSLKIDHAGVWHDVPGFGRVTAAGASASVKAQGRTIYIGTWTDPEGGSFAVEIDGRRVAMVRTRGIMGNGGAASQTNRGAALVRIPNLTNGVHKVTVRAQGNGPVALTWIGGSGSLGTAAPRVLVGDTLAMKASAIGTPAEAYGKYTEAARTAYAAAAQRVVEQLRQDGLQVSIVSVAAAYNPATQTQSDGVHPDALGRNAIADAFAGALDPQLLQAARLSGLEP